MDQLFGGILFGQEVFGLGVFDATPEYDALRGSVYVGPRLSGSVSIDERLSGRVAIGPRLTGIVRILPG